MSDIRLAGINTLASSITTLKPPGIALSTLAVITSLLLYASSSFLLPSSATSLLYVRRTCPSPSLTLRTLAFIVSPSDTTVLRSTLGLLVYSLRVIIPSALYPMLSTISSSLTLITVPSTTSPVCIVLNDSSSICSKLCSDIRINLLNNVIRG